MRQRFPILDPSILGPAFLMAVCVLPVLLVLIDRFIFTPYATALRDRVSITVAPAEWNLAATCPRCGHQWTVSARSK